MKLKNRKKTAMLLLSIILATTGCNSQKTDYKEEYKEKIGTLLDNKSLYDSSSLFGINKFIYKYFYEVFIGAAIDNMTEDEYKEFSRNIDRATKYDYDLDSILIYINDIFTVDKNTYGYGFFSMFNQQVMKSEVSSLWYLDNETLSHINTLRTLVNDDKEFYNSVFSRNINNVIDCICENTNIEDRTLVEELMLKLDQYYEVYNSKVYEDQKLCAMYESRIQEIMNIIVQTKCENDEEFNSTLYAKMLKNSKYYGESDVYIYQELLGENARFIDNRDSKFPYYITVPLNYLKSNGTIEEVKSLAIEDKITISFSEDARDYEKNFMDMLVLLLDSNALDRQRYPDKTSAQIRTSIYENLKNHFASEDEFNSFILSLILFKPSAQDFYFQLFNERLLDDGITYYDFIRYTALTNYVNDETITHFRELESDTYFTLDVPYAELLNMPQSEYEKYVHTYFESFLFDHSVDYSNYLEEGAKILSDNNLGFEECYNPNCSIEWKYGYLYPNYTSPIVTSSFVSPQSGTYNGANVIYYEYPENFIDGEAVETFLNLEGEFTVRTIPGFKGEITDPETGEEKYIYIVAIDGNKEDFTNARFGTYYYNLDKRKSLTYGGEYE